ncbi:alkaline phosphatase family protein [Geosporobacter ferrireducens]|uniref:alkaline phosphatase family protein n=1 Tax=Geosporobacter ferrireducens TaxID=1424294 RepID=UPI00139E0205|nr:alkaline phosphatase family protein [Geosporobacter ferrireducens]MTI54749.1 alkaline phosphatase family protein [Geosporobacter ferrireducens]
MGTKKKTVAVTLILLILFLTACDMLPASNSSPVPADAGTKGITLFNKDQNLVTAYIPKEKVHLGQSLGAAKENISVITDSGSVINTTADVYLSGAPMAVHIPDRDKVIENVVGIYLWEDFNSITDTFYDAKSYLDAGEKVMVVLLDGFSLKQYELAKEREYVTYLSRYFKHEALSVYTPVTNAGFAAMITGKNPDANGVYDRSFRKMKVESIFGYALNKSRRVLLLEGDIKILDTEIEPVLHMDLNRDGDIDDEIFQTAKMEAQKDYDLIFIHFHGIDDRGHSYGPEALETMDYIKKIDGYIEEISSIWNGPMLLTADHGMHKTENGGSHGMCIQEDMIVPYFKKEQRK